jgi:hypothetical protein
MRSFTMRTLGVAILSLAVAAGAAQAASQPSGDEARARAMNQRYGNAWTRVPPAEFRAVVELLGPDVTTTMTPQEVRAMVARGKELNRLYGNAWTKLSPSQFRALLASGQMLNEAYEAGGAAPRDGFDWGDAGIGVAVVFGTVLIGAAGAVAIRRRAGRAQPA